MGPLAYITLATEAITALNALLKMLSDNNLGPDAIRADLHSVVDAVIDRRVSTPQSAINFAVSRLQEVHAASSKE